MASDQSIEDEIAKKHTAESAALLELKKTFANMAPVDDSVLEKIRGTKISDADPNAYQPAHAGTPALDEAMKNVTKGSGGIGNVDMGIKGIELTKTTSPVISPLDNALTNAINGSNPANLNSPSVVLTQSQDGRVVPDQNNDIDTQQALLGKMVNPETNSGTVTILYGLDSKGIQAVEAKASTETDPVYYSEHNFADRLILQVDDAAMENSGIAAAFDADGKLTIEQDDNPAYILKISEAERQGDILILPGTIEDNQSFINSLEKLQNEQQLAQQASADPNTPAQGTDSRVIDAVIKTGI